MKQFSEACEENKDPILAVLGKVLADCRQVLEIGSGTGQHAVYFATRLPHLSWQTSDLDCNHASINAWRQDAVAGNVRKPLSLDVSCGPWPGQQYDGVFSANTTHIMSWPEVRKMFAGVGQVLVPGGVFCLYGPFNYRQRYTSESNARFDRWLRNRDPLSGLRNFEDLDELANSHGMALQQDWEMPVNNRLLVWRKTASGNS
jgi:cyclopropane fatty-acyl-phospholipid synthase-like methyltransferase